MKRLFLLVFLVAFTFSCEHRNYQPKELTVAEKFIAEKSDTEILNWDVIEINTVTSILSEKIEVVKEGIFTDEELAEGVNVDSLPMRTDFTYYLVYKNKIYLDIFTFHSMHNSNDEVVKYLLELYNEKYPKPFKY